ncbi:3-deoxy-D-manno-octulosonic acid transferase [Thalassococcus sp. S3]|uniref:3-deoxy-D-manno-octulosonic acid transferase n=1 Tax=Thalassococcus sp. S3 TaxID=2017482 RepID=UPI001024694B|nr:3-deoxy-D-manno-octulosonic acid transferase [Thalassococcus sp. S3]QBF31314.1 3-deoxy-D-manno-octulosonic acid transferase [Thalassococcus sp. S3]
MTPSGGRPTPLYRIYRSLTAAAVPLAYWSVTRKLRKAGVDAERLPERAGTASLDRPDGPLVWFHAASVGESLGALTLIRAMGGRRADLSFLITSGTATSAEMITKRLPPRTQHQFAPLDAPGPVRRFLTHWRPQAGVFVESELWPNMLLEAQKAGLHLALVNARLSRKSVEGWRKWPDTARLVMDVFDLLISQNREMRENLIAMGADPDRVQQGVNLKALAAPPPVDAPALSDLKTALAGRPLWVASSTHPGEEEVVLSAHKTLLARHPDLCLLLIPRHPERGAEVAKLCRDRGLSVAQRSAKETPAAQVYLADTLGETGTWYAASPIVFVGGSLQPIGGHNPYEPAQAGAAILTGPHFASFSETYPPLIALGGAVEIEDPQALSEAVERWLVDEGALEQARAASKRFVARQSEGLEEMVNGLLSALRLEAPHGA